VFDSSWSWYVRVDVYWNPFCDLYNEL
jgi:hypothetical protein